MLEERHYLLSFFPYIYTYIFQRYYNNIYYISYVDAIIKNNNEIKFSNLTDAITFSKLPFFANDAWFPHFFKIY